MEMVTLTGKSYTTEFREYNADVGRAGRSAGGKKEKK